MYIFYWPYYFGLFLEMQHRFDRTLLSNKARVHADQKLNQVERVIITIYINQNVFFINCGMHYGIPYTIIHIPPDHAQVNCCSWKWIVWKNLGWSANCWLRQPNFILQFTFGLQLTFSCNSLVHDPAHYIKHSVS